MGAVKRTRFIITGQVQGVGFRPFVFRLASQYTLSGSVRNTPQGVIIEAQGKSAQVCAFALDLREKLPPLARIITFEQEDIAPQTNEADFKILSSTSGTGHTDFATAKPNISSKRKRQKKNWILRLAHRMTRGKQDSYEGFRAAI